MNREKSAKAVPLRRSRKHTAAMHASASAAKRHRVASRSSFDTFDECPKFRLSAMGLETWPSGHPKLHISDLETLGRSCLIIHAAAIH